MVWLCPPFLIGPIILGLDGGTPEWGPIALFLATMLIITASAEFANTYTDRVEDNLYFPSNPIVTGELSVGTARKALISQNIVVGALLIALLLITLNPPLIVVMLVGWLVGLAYSVPPFRLKETVAAPFLYGLAYALPPIAAWLVVEPSLTARSGLIAAFAALLFLHSFGYGITVKFRKTFHALNSGLIQVEQGGSVYNLGTAGLGLKVKTAMALEAITTLGAFILVPIFWRLGIFDSALSIGLLAAALPPTVIAIGTRMKDPVKNGPKCLVFMTMAGVSIGLVLFSVALASLVHWGFAVLACIVYLIGFIPLFATIHPFGRKALIAPWSDI